VDPYTILNLSAGYNLGLFNTRLKMMIEINNLLDSKILLFASGADNFFPLASRSIFFKAALEIF
ncbi:MAG: TonB-dependent receptor, partial [Ignavibacteriaceae bacterium]|nr:TonB-dependent receptor [Ignavibacteriaceae bacterium]